MGSVSIMKAGFWPSFNNQALLAYNRTFSAGIDYQNRFNISELGIRTAGVVIPAGKTSVGIIYSHAGYSEFRREMTGIACGLNLLENIAGGVQVEYFSERASGEYQRKQSLTFEAGLSIRPSETITIGIHTFNPLPNSIRKAYLPSSLTAGLGIELNKALFAGAEAEMSSEDKLVLRTGFEYQTIENLWLRGGFSTENTSFSFGLGYLFKSLKLDLSFSTHEKLGLTSSASIVFKIR